MYILYLTFIFSISYFHIFYNHISHKISIHTSHISLNSMSHKVIIYKIHIQQSIYIYFLYILQTPYLTKHIYFLPSPYISKDIKHSSKNMLQKPLSGKAYNHNAKSPWYERHKVIVLKVFLMEGNITYIWLKLKEHYMGKII